MVTLKRSHFSKCREVTEPKMSSTTFIVQISTFQPYPSKGKDNFHDWYLPQCLLVLPKRSVWFKPTRWLSKFEAKYVKKFRRDFFFSNGYRYKSHFWICINVVSSEMLLSISSSIFSFYGGDLFLCNSPY